LPVAPGSHVLATKGGQLKAAKARPDVQRGSSTEQGYGSKWREARLAHLSEHPLCVRCDAEGFVTAATVVDHIQPHKGDRNLFWSRSNWQSLCETHHNRKTAMEDGGFGNGAWLDWHPEWMPRSVVPVTLVCGAPASGKTTYVQQHMRPGDVVIDLDEIGAALSGQVSHDWPLSYLRAAGHERNRRIAALSDAEAVRGVGRAWLIVGEADAARRQWWCDKLGDVTVVVMATPYEVCVARVRGDRRRARKVEALADAIGKWWLAYRPRQGDVVAVFRHAYRTGH
jgi:5-methylcytosine-specific restriction protein A